MSIKPISRTLPKDLDAVMATGKARGWKCPQAGGFGAIAELYRVEDLTPETFDLIASQNPGYQVAQIGYTHSALSIAIKRGTLPLISHLLDKDSSLHAIAVRDDQHILKPPLSYAISLGSSQRLSIVKLLVSRNADINMGGFADDRPSETALFIAADKGDFVLMHYLLLRGGIVYKGHLDALTKYPVCTRVRKNLTQAVEELLAMQLFKNRTLHSKRSESFFSYLPDEIRIHVFKFLQIKD